MKPHKHAELIKAWAEGAEIEVYSESFGKWVLQEHPSWGLFLNYRVKAKKPKRILVVKTFSPDTNLVRERSPHKDIEKYFNLHELVQEHETDWYLQNCEIYKNIFEEKYETLRDRGRYVQTLGTIRMSKVCAEKLCGMLNRGEVELCKI